MELFNGKAGVHQYIVTRANSFHEVKMNLAGGVAIARQGNVTAYLYDFQGNGYAHGFLSRSFGYMFIGYQGLSEGNSAIVGRNKMLLQDAKSRLPQTADAPGKQIAVLEASAA